MRRCLLLSLTLLGLFNEGYAQKRWHIMPTAEEIEYRQQHPKTNSTRALNKPTASTFTMPADARIPGEFEESQAVSLAWIYFNGVDVSSEYAEIWGQMAAAIQEECEVWIRIENGADSNAIKTYMAGRGTPLKRYRFHVTVGDDFWVRDFGPLSFYYGSDDKIGMLDMNYYPGRDYDNLYPGWLANEMGYLDVKTNLYAEGGNFITDGFHNSFHSDRVDWINQQAGPNAPNHAQWTPQQVADTVKYVWASKSVMSTPELICDGGTGHNDMFMKLMDENTFAIMEYPSVVTAQDKKTIDDIIATLSNTNTVYGKKYRIFKLPMPTQDNGNRLALCGLINNDARTFVNGTTVNHTYLMPTFANSTDGNKTQEQEAIAIFNKNAPGYKVVPIDSRALTILGGAIHCVNMQIPAENPITIWHPPVQDLQPKTNSYHIIVKATNKSGISGSVCQWRVRGSSTWNSVNLTDSSGYKIGDIKSKFRTSDVVEYYVSATSNNGKTMTKPIVAPTGGYYSFYFDAAAAGVEEMDRSRNFALNPLPNPSNGSFVVPVSFDAPREITATVTDVMGKRIAVQNFGKREAGMSKLEFDIQNAAAGMYFVQIMADGQILDTKRILKQ